MITLILIWLLIAYGQSNILVYGSIFNGFRDFLRKWGTNPYSPFNQVGMFISDLLSCMMCTSTWVGFFLSIAFYSPANSLFNIHPAFSWFFDGMLASGFVWAFNGIIEWFEENRPNKHL
jgi:hypothetical protein